MFVCPALGSLVINTVVGLLAGRVAYTVVLLYTGLMAVMFMSNTLRNAIPEHSHVSANAKRNYLLIGSGARPPPCRACVSRVCDLLTFDELVCSLFLCARVPPTAGLAACSSC